MEGRYEIRSKLKPSLVLFKGWSPDIDKDIEKHKFYLHKKIHPIPQLLNHVLKFGMDDFDFVTEQPIERAVVDVRSEKRGKIGKAKEVHS